MKKLTLLFTFIVSLGFSQETENLTKIIDASSITWLGLDFTTTTFLDSYDRPGFNDPERIKSYFFREWNEIIYTEPDKYNLKNYFRKDEVATAMTEMMTTNESIGIQSAIKVGRENPERLRTDEELKKVIDGYTFKGLEGIGATIIITEMNKEEQKAIGYLVFLDLSTKELLYTRKMEGEARGFGFRNYWLRTFYEMYNEIDLQRWFIEEQKKRKKKK